ncbi:MAG: AAA family ATPase [Bacteroidales bacterium]
MELLYIWIEKFKNLKSIGFNLTNQFIVDFLKTESGYKVKIYENPDFFKDFFGGNILSLVAVVGKNGVGKSNLIEAIREVDLDGIRIFKDNKNNFIFQYPLYWRKPPKVEFDKPDLWRIEPNYNDIYMKLNDGFTIFYSPIFDLRGWPYKKFPKDIDVSTNYLIHADNEENRFGIMDVDMIEMHRFKNVERQINLSIQPIAPISSHPNEFAIKFPDTIEISTNDIKDQDSEDRKWNLDWNSKQVRDILKVKYIALLHKYVDNEHKSGLRKGNIKRLEWVKEKTKIKFIYTFVDNFFYNRNRENTFLDTNLDVNIDEISKLDFIEAVMLFSKQQNWISETILSGFFQNIISLFDSIAPTEEIIDHNFSSILIKDKTKVVEVYSWLLNYLSEISLVNNKYAVQPISFNWRDMSAGEKAIFDFFSRLLYAKNQIVEIVKDSNKESDSKEKISTIKLFLDEPDLVLHPEWQRKFLHQLIHFLPLCFYDGKYIPNPRFQIILTSHSPILLSDIPRNNIIYLDRDQKGNAKLIPNGYKPEQTFGANIHSLYTDSFFLEGGLIGEFAKEKISKVLNYLKSNPIENESSEFTKETSLEIIEMIGEPLIRNQLLDLWNNVFKEPSIDELKIRILKLEEENKNLKNETNKN